VSRPTVLQLIETGGVGGAETVLLQLATGLRPQFEPVVGMFRGGWLRERLDEAGIETVRFSNKGRYDGALVSSIAEFARRRGVDLIHSHLFTMSVYATMAARLARVPSIFTIHGTGEEWRAGSRLWAMRLAARLSDRIVTVSDYLRALVIRRLRVPQGRVVRIYNGVDLDRFAAERSGNGPVVGTVGRLRPEKGHSYLLEAAKLVVEELPAARFVLVGDGPCLKDLELQRDTLGLSGSVAFLGHQTNIPELLGQMSVFVLPSTSEGLSIATIEAQAAGLPAVVTECGGPAEVVVHAETGMVVPPTDPNALAKAILCLLRNPALAGNFGERGRRRVAQEFSLDRMLSSYAKLYARLMAKRQPLGVEVGA